MLEIVASARTNYFRVTDEVAFEKWFNKLSTEKGIRHETVIEENGQIRHMFASYSSIKFHDAESDDRFALLEELQPLLPIDEAFIYTEITNCKLDYVNGCSVVLTRNEIMAYNLMELSTNIASEMLGNLDADIKFQ